jgi:ankyrin repeat protein
MNFPRIEEESCLRDIKRWVEEGGSAKITHRESGWTLLHIASEFQCVEAIEYLIGLGCDPNSPDMYGQTPLHFAVDSEIDATIQTGVPLLYKTTKRLLELGADLNVKNNKGETPMDWINNYGENARKIFKDVMNTEKSV